MAAGDREYVDRLGAVLRRRDPSALREFLIEQAGRFGDERQVARVRDLDVAELETTLHRMILARADLADLHDESDRWLAAHGIGPSAGARPPSDKGARGGPGSSRRGRRTRYQ